jgi:hypothetical protein
MTELRKTMVNTDVNTRRWDGLQRVEDKVDPEAGILASVGSTLELEPGEQADVVVPSNFVDPWLKEAKVGAPKRDVQKKETSLSETKEG